MLPNSLIQRFTPRHRLHLAALAFTGALLTAFFQIPRMDDPALLPPALTTASPLPPFFHVSHLPSVGDANYAPTLAQLPDGRLAAAWVTEFEHRRGRESAIAFSLLTAQGWDEPRLIASREDTAGALFAHVRDLSDPVLHAEGETLHLWFTHTGIGAWAGKTLSHRVSPDGGMNWAPATRLQAGPLGNLGHQLQAPPVRLADGGWGLPLGQHFFTPHSAWLRLDREGKPVDKRRIGAGTDSLAPAVLALDGHTALAVLRLSDAPGAVAASSPNAGANWQSADLTLPELVGPSVAVLSLADGSLLLAGNPAQGVGTLALWRSFDRGATWALARTVENAADGSAEFTAPRLIQGRDGRLHLAYHARGQQIRHATFSPAWLDGERP